MGANPSLLLQAHAVESWDSRIISMFEDNHFLLKEIFPIQGSDPHLLCVMHRQVGSLLLAPPGKPLKAIG